MKVLLVVHHRFDLWKLPAWFGQRLAQQYPDLQSVQRDSYEGIETHLRDAEAVFTISLRSDQFAAARSLRWIHTPSAAVPDALSGTDRQLGNSDQFARSERAGGR